MSQVHLDSGLFPLTPHFLMELKNCRWLSCLQHSTFQAVREALQMRFWAWLPREESLEMPFDIIKGFSFTGSCQQSKLFSAGTQSADDFAGTD